MNFIHNMCWGITFLKSLPHLPGTNTLLVKLVNPVSPSCDYLLCCGPSPPGNCHVPFMLYPFTFRTSRPKTSCRCWSLNHLHIWQIQVWLYESDMVYLSPRLPAVDGHADHNRCGLGLYVTIRADAACTSVTAALPGERWVWNVNPCHAEFIYEICTFGFLSISEHWGGVGYWNPSFWKTRTPLPCKVNTMAADDLVTQEAKAAALMVLT